MVKIKIVYFVMGVMLFIDGCAKHKIMMHKDKTPYSTKECNRALYRGIERSGVQIDMIYVFKKQRKLYAYSKGKKIYTFRISLGKNADKGHKIQAGDYRTPTGHYRIIRKKCDRRLYRSLMISYPDSEDRARSRRLGVKPGGYITIHGQPKWNQHGEGDNYTLSRDWTEGCIAVTNRAMDALWSAVKNGVKIDIYK